MTIIANQGVQIAHSVTQISKITEQMTEIKNQYAHLKNEALGHVGALTDPFVTLAAVPGTYVSDGLAWRTAYTGTTTAGLIDAFELFSASGTPMTDYWQTRLDAAPDTTEADVLAEYNGFPVSLADRAAANYRRHRDHGQQRKPRRVRSSTRPRPTRPRLSDPRVTRSPCCAGRPTNQARRFNRRRSQAPLPPAKCPPPFLQLHAHEAARRAAEELEAEERRREREAARLDRIRTARAAHARHVAGIEASRDGGDELLFSLVQ